MYHSIGIDIFKATLQVYIPIKNEKLVLTIQLQPLGLCIPNSNIIKKRPSTSSLYLTYGDIFFCIKALLC